APTRSVGADMLSPTGDSKSLGRASAQASQKLAEKITDKFTDKFADKLNDKVAEKFADKAPIKSSNNRSNRDNDDSVSGSSFLNTNPRAKLVNSKLDKEEVATPKEASAPVEDSRDDESSSFESSLKKVKTSPKAKAPSRFSPVSQNESDLKGE